MRIESVDSNNRSGGPVPQESPGQSKLLSASDYLYQVPNGQTSSDPLNKPLFSPVADHESYISPASHAWDNNITTSADGDPFSLLTSSTIPSIYDLGGSLSLDEPDLTELYSLRSPSTLGTDPTLGSPKAFLPKKTGNVNSWLNQAYVITSLRSYPEMLISGKTLPPFIHPSCSVTTVQNHQTVGFDTRPELPEPLAICMSVVQMFKAKNKENSSFVWSTVREAQEKLARDFRSYSDWDTVAALQAVTVYFILRISEDEDTGHVNFDVQLIQTMVRISLNVSNFSHKYAPTSNGCLPGWKNWILIESIRRTTTILLLIDQFFDIRPGLPNFYCDGAYLRSMLLPCSRKLWQADNESTWEAEYTSDAGMQGQKVRLRYGDLVEFNSLADISGYSWKGPLEGWLAQADDLGISIMAAASTVLPSTNAPQGSQRQRSPLRV